MNPASHRPQAMTMPRDLTPGNMLGNVVMIVMAMSVIVMGVRVPGFIDNTIRTCVQVLGVN